MHKIATLKLIPLVLIILITSCNNNEGGIEVTVVQTAVSPIVSPISTPASEPDGSEVAGQETVPDHIDIPEPEQGFGTVGGILLVRTPSSDTYKTLPITPVYLAPLIYGDDGQSYFAGLDYSSDPTTTTNQTGVFIIRNVPAGEYGFVVMRGVSPVLIKNDQGGDYIITVEAGKALDLGEIRAEVPDL